jgi:hypothetical protein
MPIVDSSLYAGIISVTGTNFLTVEVICSLRDSVSLLEIDTRAFETAFLLYRCNTSSGNDSLYERVGLGKESLLSELRRINNEDIDFNISFDRDE